MSDEERVNRLPGLPGWKKGKKMDSCFRRNDIRGAGMTEEKRRE